MDKSFEIVGVSVRVRFCAPCRRREGAACYLRYSRAAMRCGPARKSVNVCEGVKRIPLLGDVVKVSVTWGVRDGGLTRAMGCGFVRAVRIRDGFATTAARGDRRSINCSSMVPARITVWSGKASAVNLPVVAHGDTGFKSLRARAS